MGFATLIQIGKLHNQSADKNTLWIFSQSNKREYIFVTAAESAEIF